jgi:hypothetical protein
MEEESILSVAIAWTVLGMVFSVWLLVKIDALNPGVKEIPLDEPRVFDQEMVQDYSE